MDRRFLLAMALIMVILFGPGLLFKRPVPEPVVAGDSLGFPSLDSGVDDTEDAADLDPQAAPTVSAISQDTPPGALEDTVVVTSDLYQYGFSTRGGRLVSAVLANYTYTVDSLKNQSVELMLPGSDLLALRLIVGRDTLHLDDWVFAPTAERVSVDQPARLGLSATQGGVTVTLDYQFEPGTYYVAVTGSVTGLGPNGGLLLVGMGPGLANTEENRSENTREMGFVTRNGGSDLTRFSSLDPGETVVEPGPFEWVAVKSKYFVTAVLAVDSGAALLSGVTASVPVAAPKKPETADLWVSQAVRTDGAFRYRLYAGPMEYPRLKSIGHGFYDVNPYGWPGLRTIIRPVAVAARWVLVWMHETLNLHYGWVLILFGILIRIVLWPLNQKAMRSSIRMQAVQPLMKEIQTKYKDQPEKLQKETFKLYKEHNVNPLGGCWPMLLPFPVLIALFFVFQNTIELRGVSFLWLPDLAQADPLYIIPLLMGISMFAVSKVGQMGMEPNPQMKAMLYVMPVMMTVLFARFASGLNLYYTVQNLVSVPQQWMLAKERVKANPPKKEAPAAPAPAEPSGGQPSRPKQLKRKKRR
jgi:YidC/Oxa1 family membrane protein insertase